jgi:hypothetical protein
MDRSAAWPGGGWCNAEGRIRRAPDVDLVQVEDWATDLQALNDRIGSRFSITLGVQV